MSKTYQKLGIEFTQYSKDQLDEAVDNLQSLRLEQILVGECEPFDWNNLLQRPELVECKDPSKVSMMKNEDEETRIKTKNSFFLFKHDGIFRQTIMNAVETTIYRRCMLLIATLNLFAFCLYDSGKDNSYIGRISVGIEIFCNIIFASEILMKSISDGFIIGQSTFMRKPWNIVQVLTFFSTWSILAENQTTFITILRTIRLLRVFRFVLEIPSLKTQLDAYFGSFSRLGPILVPIIFVVLFYSIVGLHLFLGVTEYRCRITEHPEDGKWEDDPSIERLCGIWQCPEGTYCGSPAQYDLPRHFKENDSEAFNWNYSRFDDFFTSLLVVFTFLNITGWSGTNFIFWKAMTTYVTALYFLTLIVLLAFILSNLLLGIFYESFMVQSAIKNSQNRAKKEQMQIEDEIQKKKQQQMMDRLAAISSTRKKKMQNNIQNLTFSLYYDKKQTGSKILLANISNQVSKSLYFIVINSVMIMINTFSILFDYDGIDKNTWENMMILDFICTIYSFVELFVQLLGKGMSYMKKTVNKLDFIIILSQLILFAVIYIQGGLIIKNTNRWICLVKSIKILRLLKFLYAAKLFYNISILTRSALYTIIKIKNILLLWAAFVLLVSLIGQELLGNKVEGLLINYDNFGDALIASVNIFYNEEWHITMYQYAKATNVSFAFHITFIVLGQIFFIRLLTAVFLNEFCSQLKKMEASIKPITYEKTANQFMATLKNIRSKETSITKRERNFMFESVAQHPMNQVNQENLVRRGILKALRVDKKLIQVDGVKNKIDVIQENAEILDDDYSNKSPDPNPFQHIQQIQTIPQFPSQVLSIEKQHSLINTPVKQSLEKSQISKSLMIFQKDSQVRQLITKLIETKFFRIFSLILIVITSVRIAQVNPLLDPHSEKASILQKIYIVLTVCYAIQVLFNIIAYGLITDTQSYMRRSIYNSMNVLITLLEILSIIIGINNNQVFNFFSSLRILEFIQIGAYLSQDIMFAQRALLNAFVKMIQLSIFCFVILSMYGIFATKLLKGYNYKCSGIDEEQGIEIHTKFDCLDYGGSWVNQTPGFDNVFDSALSLFIISTSEGWLLILEETMAAKGINQEPEENHDRTWAIYYQVFFFIGNLCMLNMFIGLVVNTYQEAKLKAQGYDTLDENQREWQHIKHSIFKLTPKTKSQIPENQIRVLAFKLVKNQYWKRFWLIIIFLDTICLSLYIHRQNKNFRLALDYTNQILIYIQAFEIVCRFIAKDLKMFFKDLPNIIDIFGIWICIIQVHIIQTSDDFFFNRCFTALSVAIQLLRNYRIIKRFNAIETLFQSIFSVIPSALSMMYIMFIILFIFTNLGMNLFAFMRPQQFLNDFDSHFRTFTTAMFTLVKVASSEQWFRQLTDSVHVIQPDFACLVINNYEDFQEHGFNGCGSLIGYAYFLLFHLIFSLVILNLFIASLINAYEEHCKQEQSAISKYQLTDVLRLWAQYDPLGKAFLTYKQFWKLSSEIAIIFGVNQQDLLNPANKTNFLKALNLQLYENEEQLIGFLFHDVILNLTRISVTLKYGVSKYIIYIQIFFSQYSLEPNDESVGAKKYKQNYRKFYKRTPYNSGHMGAIIFLQKKIRMLINKKKGGGFLQIEDLKKALSEQQQ